MVCFRKAVLVSWSGSPLGRDLNHTWPTFPEFPKLPGPRRNATSLPSRDTVGISAASSKFVSCSQRRCGRFAVIPRVRRGHNSPGCGDQSADSGTAYDWHEPTPRPFPWRGCKRYDG